jgi:histidyl-tRNA synthetase
MKIPPVKGTRDFYPADMAVRNFIIDGWKKVSIRNGFEEYDGPILEHLQMYTQKSGDEIVEQLFSLTDRGGRDLALRPEITPTLARMVNQRINSLPKPIKWFSVPRLCRAERPQKGRLREFFQWNIDIIGAEGSRADAEVIFTTVDYLRSVGLTPEDIKVKISSRKLLTAALRNFGIQTDDLNPLYSLLDKKAKLPKDTFEKLLQEQIGDQIIVKKILEFMSTDDINNVAKLVKGNFSENDIEQLYEVIASLGYMGVHKYCVFDPSIVRGLAYYTGIVFEVHDTAGEFRAVCGGGRFDNLLHDFGGPSVSATGMGMGDCVLEILLREKGLLDKQIKKPELDYFVACLGVVGKETWKIIGRLRSMGYSTIFSYKMGGLTRQMAEASAQNVKKCIIIGEEELQKNEIKIKDMTTGEQETVPIDKFMDGLIKSK